MAGRINDKKLHSLIINTIIDLNNQDLIFFVTLLEMVKANLNYKKSLRKIK